MYLKFMFLQAGKISAEDVLQILRPLASHSKAFNSIFQDDDSDGESETADLAYIHSEMQSQDLSDSSSCNLPAQ